MRKIPAKWTQGIVAVSLAAMVGIAVQWIPWNSAPKKSERLDAHCLERLGEVPLLSQRWKGRFEIGPSELTSATPDYLVALALEVDRQWLPLCVSESALQLGATLKREYLKRLGFDAQTRTAREVDRWFRLSVAVGDPFNALKEQLASVDRSDPDKALQGIVGPVRWFQPLSRRQPSATEPRTSGIPMLGASEAEASAMDVILSTICRSEGECLFFDPRAITQVRMTEVTPMAAYVAATGTLVLSRALLADPESELNRVVIAHELAHSAILLARWIRGEDWIDNFAPFSGWKKNADGTWGASVFEERGNREDRIATESANSPFASLPDPLLVSEEKMDGFIFAKAYREKNPEEDLADAIAAWAFAPQRFCYQGKNIAPHKYRWITDVVFIAPETPPIACAQPPMDPPAPTPIKSAKKRR